MLLLVLFLRNCIRTMRNNLLSGDILFADTPRVIVMFSMILDEGGGRHCPYVFRRKGRLWLLLAWGYLLI
jgi:hypothetical protein